MKAADLSNITVDGVEYRVSVSNPDNKDLTVEYRENVNEYRWAVAVEKVPVAASKDVTVQITYYDPAIEGNSQIATGYEHVTVTEGAEPVVLKAADLSNITVDGVEYRVSVSNPDNKDLTVEYRENVNEYRWAVAVEKVPVAASKDVTVRIQYLDGTNMIAERYEQVTVTEGAEPVVLKASELSNVTVDGVEYKVTANTSDFSVEYNAQDEFIWEVLAEKIETDPEEKETLATLKVTYKDGETVVGEDELSAMGIDGKDHTFTANALTIPEGYELVANFADVTVKYGETVSVEVAVKAISEPEVPVEMANATLHISYTYNGREKSTQDITAVGKKGDSHTFTAENVTLQVPNGYRLNKKFADVTVVFGETKNIELAVSYASSGSSSGGGSGSGGSGSISSSSSKQLENGRWVQDSIGWWYSFNNGTYAKSGWYSLKWENKTDWYYFNDAGYLISGWFEDKGLKYYLHDLHDGTFGRMYTGWNKIGEQWYYFNDTTEGVLGALKPDAQVPEELLNK